MELFSKIASATEFTPGATKTGFYKNKYKSDTYI